jgi:hypothetical protein
MGTVSQIADFFEDDELLDTISLEQSKVLLDLFMLTIIMDGEISDQELETFDEELSRLPFAKNEAHIEQIGDYGVESKERILAIAGDDDAVDAYLADLAERFGPDVELRKKALAMVAALSYSDGFDDQEDHLCQQLGVAFGLEQATILAVIDTTITTLDELAYDNTEEETEILDPGD